jgi:hypothetical protein
LALKAGATLWHHEWKGYADQKNWAIRELRLIGYRWVLCIDADEVVSAGLAEELRDIAAQSSDLQGAWIPRRLVFMGRPIRHATWYPDLQLRFLRTDAGFFEDRRVHEHAVVNGRTTHTRHWLVHMDRKPVGAWLERHCRYAVLEAQARAYGQTTRRGSLFGSWEERRAFLKRLWPYIPCRPFVRFFWLYVVKRGFLDGPQGLAYCKGLLAYELMIDVARVDVRTQKRVNAERLPSAADDPASRSANRD